MARIAALVHAAVDEVTNPVTRPTFWALVSGAVAIAWPGHAVPTSVQDFVVAAAGLVAAVDVGGRYHVHAKVQGAAALDAATAAARAASAELQRVMAAGGGQ